MGKANHRAIHLLWLGCVSALLFSQEVQETQRVVVIEVPVQVIRNGAPVTGLTRDQFTLLDNGRKQEILNVEEVVWQRPDATQPSETPTPSAARPSDRRHFFLLFDLLFSDRFTLRKAANAALDLVQNGLHPQDLVSVALFGASEGVVVFTGFTDDRERVTQAINQLAKLTNRKERRRITKEMEKQNLKKFDPLLLAANREDEPLPGLLYQEKLEAARMAINDRGGTLGGLKLLKKELAKMAHMVKVGIPNSVGDGTLNLSYGASLVANAFRDIEGRKYMVLLSKGFSNDILTDEAYGGMVRSHQESMFKVFRQTNWAVHAIDIKGLRPNGANFSQDGLFQMAADTGGKFYRNYNNTSRAFEKLLDNTSVVYRLTFSPDKLEFDGSYHKLKVKLKNVPVGTRVQYARRGYFAPEPEGTAQELSSADKATLILGETTVDALETRVTAQPMYTRDSKTKVSVLFESKGEALVKDHIAPELELETYIYALNEDREIIDFSAQSFSLNLSKNRFMMRRSPRIFANLNLSTGTYELRYLVLNTLTQKYSLGSYDLTVPDFNLTEPLFTTPVFPRTFDQGMVINLRAEKFIFEQQDYPYVAGDYLYIPRIAPRLKAKSRQPLVLGIVESGKGRWTFQHRILSSAGEEKVSGRLKTQKSAAIREGGVYKTLGLLNLSGLDDGRYLLEITATDSKSETDVVQKVEFEIGNPGQY